AAGKEPPPQLPVNDSQVGLKQGETEAMPEPEVASIWNISEILEEESYARPGPEVISPSAQPITPEEIPSTLTVPPAVPPGASEPTVVAVPSRDPLEELDDIIFDEELPPGIKEDQLPTLAEATSAKLELPDFDDFDSLFDEISGLGDPASKVE